MPGEADEGVERETATATDLSTGSTGTAHAEFVPGDDVAVRRVLAKADVSDFEFNVNFDGNALFSGAQSLSATGTWEEFTPDQNQVVTGSVAAELQAEVTSSGSAGNSDYIVEYERE